jgi:phosphatidylserine/phosphatidylglycerophosphate/cardiolipin synthase-like enzyme
MHCKAAVVDSSVALISTANPTWSGFGSDGEVLVTSQAPEDVADVNSSIAGQPVSGNQVVAGPGASLRLHLQHLLQSSSDLRIATEGLSDKQVVDDLRARSAAGHHDRVLIGAERFTSAQLQAIRHLHDDGVDVRALAGVYMHEKFVDDGDEIYLGSANLTHNGIEEGREIGVVAPASAFGAAAGTLQARFDTMWSNAIPVSV